MMERFLAAAQADLAAASYEWLHEKAAQKCESPIEQCMLAAMSFHFMLAAWVRNGRHCRVHISDEPPTGNRTTDWPLVTIVPQFQLDDFRVDFALFWLDGRLFVVECDGHEFHERTAEQAERDRRRDRMLQQRNIPIFRFTGREIYRDSIKCASEISEFWYEKIRPKAKDEGDK
jgi:very-short-patch-repair endonuclease